jgi:hypothetical protein
MLVEVNNITISEGLASSEPSILEPGHNQQTGVETTKRQANRGSPESNVA